MNKSNFCNGQQDNHFKVFAKLVDLTWKMENLDVTLTQLDALDYTPSESNDLRKEYNKLEKQRNKLESYVIHHYETMLEQLAFTKMALSDMKALYELRNPTDF